MYTVPMPEDRGNDPQHPQDKNPYPPTQPLPRPSKGSSKRTRKRTRPNGHATEHKSKLAHNLDKPSLYIDDFMEFCCAIQFSSYVPSPILDAGGLMLVAPSGSLKSSLLTSISNLYPSRCICESNWYYSKLIKLSGSFYNRSIRSIVVPELASIYAGDPRTSGRMEQAFQQMAGEGLLSTNETDSRFARYEMRSTIFAAMTPEFASKHHKGWEEGFHRRFLWAHLAMENDEILMDYLIEWKKANIEMSLPIMEPSDGTIPDLLTAKEKSQLSKMLIEQKAFGPNHTRFITFAKAVSVLRWHYKRMKINKDAIETARRFSGCLSDRAAILIIPHVKKG